MILSALILSFDVQAAKKVYNVELELVQGGESRAVKLKLNENQFGKTLRKKNTDGSFIELVATKEDIEGQKGIMLNFMVGETNKKGEAVIVSRPQVFTQPNSKSQVTVTHEDGNEDLKLSVIVK